MTPKLKRRAWYPWLFIMLCGIFVTVVLLFVKDRPLELVVVVVGTVGGFTHFLYVQHQQDVVLFNDLFRDFNKRYNALNSDLNAIVSRTKGAPLQKEEESILCDYFNLCAEEHLFHDAGYIDQRVWYAWCKGMLFYADNNPEILKFWEKELCSNSYYGFSLVKIRAALP